MFYRISLLFFCIPNSAPTELDARGGEADPGELTALMNREQYQEYLGGLL